MYTLLPYLVAAAANWFLFAQVPIAATTAAVDNQNNFYVVDERNTILKLDSLGNELYRYHRNTGTLANVDPTNPLKPLLYYADTRTVVVTDNTLSPSTVLSLQAFGYTQVPAACRAADDNVWLYDAANYRLTKIDLSGNALRQGSDLLQQTGFAADVRFMIEYEQKVYLCDSMHGVLVTDLYGNYEKTIPIKGLQRFQFINNHLLYFTASSMMLYDLRTAQTDSMSLDGVAPFQQAVYNNDKLLALEQNRVSLYRLAKP